MIKALFNGLIDLIYPPHCFTCQNYIPPDSTNKELCLECIKKIKFNIPPFCLKCSRHLEQPVKHPVCQSCRKIKPHFDFAWCACLYSNELKQLIHQFKYSQKTQLKHLFISLMVNFIQTYSLDIQQFDLIMPISLHTTRLRERGFNQSEILARGIAFQFDLNFCNNNLIRFRHTKPQASLRQKERWTNIQGAFRIKHPGAVKGKNILIIDDLLTTGSTASEAACILKSAGVARVGILTLAVA